VYIVTRSQTTYHVVSRPWPAELPHPVPIDEARGIWLSVVPDALDAPAYHVAWRRAGYSGLIYLRSLDAWRPYRNGWYVRSDSCLASAAGHVGLPTLLSRAGFRLAALLHRAGALLGRGCRRYERWCLARRARRLLREVH
jgi:hypothetical protein